MHRTHLFARKLHFTTAFASPTIPRALHSLTTPLHTATRPPARTPAPRHATLRMASDDASRKSAQEAYRDFVPSRKSVVLATASRTGEAHASVAPFVFDDARNIYVFVSGLSTHTAHLHERERASALFTTDEADTPDMFARTRLSYDCSATLLPRGEAAWEAAADRFATRFGDIVGVLRDLPDFRIFRLTPLKGRFVLGFGQAYNVNPRNLAELVHVRK